MLTMLIKQGQGRVYIAKASDHMIDPDSFHLMAFIANHGPR